MTNTIGEFIKSVFPSTVDRNGEVFKALLADGSGGGSIEAVFENLEETRAAWQDSSDAYSLLEEQNEKLFGLISLLSQTDASSDSVYIERNKMLFDGERTNRAPWGSAYDIKALFKAFFEIDEVWLINNCASIDESLLTDGDFENEQEAWVLSGAEVARDSAFSGNISVQIESGGTLRQTVAIEDAGAYFLNFFLQGSVRVRVTNSAGQHWQPIENGTGSWQSSDAYWDFASADWDNRQCFFVLGAADIATIEFEALEAGTVIDYVRLHLKTASSMFTVIAGFEGGVSSDETASYAPPKTAKLGLATVGRARTWIAGDDGDALGVNYDVMSYMDNNYIFGPSGMRAQEIANTFLELVKPAGVTGYMEILTAETEVSSAEDNSGESGDNNNEGNNDGDNAPAVDYETKNDGTWLVYTADGLLAWNEAAQTNPSLSCLLEANIDMTGKSWTPVGSENSYYKGAFDGNGHTVSNLNIDTTGNYAGFFGYIGSGGSVKNLGVSIASFANGATYAGGIAGFNSGGEITACYSTGDVAGVQAGGIAGWSNGAIAACYSTGDVTGTTYAGGIAGFNRDSGTITACYSTGDVTGTTYAGGIAGFNSGGEITACYSTGGVAGNYAGGIAGYNDSTITACYWSGSVNNAVGDSGSSGSATNFCKVDGDTVTWTGAAMGAMNSALSGAGASWRYEENDGADSDAMPLTLVNDGGGNNADENTE